jgi:CHAT domain-containing protein
LEYRERKIQGQLPWKKKFLDFERKQPGGPGAYALSMINQYFVEHGSTLNQLGVLLLHRARYAEAEQLLQRARVSAEEGRGPTHPDLSTVWNNIAWAQRNQKRFNEALAANRRSIAIATSALGPSHALVAAAHADLARTHMAMSNLPEALASIRAASRSLAAASRGGFGSTEVHYLHVEILYAVVAGRSDGQEVRGLMREAWEATQRAQTRDIAIAIEMAASRTIAGDARVRGRLDESQRLEAELMTIRGELAALYLGGTDPATRTRRAQLLERQNSISLRRQTLLREIVALAPAYDGMISNSAVSLDASQALLRPGEALVSILPDTKGTTVWIVTPTDVRWSQAALGEKELEEKVKKLRLGLAGGPKASFDVAASFSLYRALFGASEPLMRGIKHLIIVPTGPLTGIPFSILVTEPPPASILRNEEYRAVSWLIGRSAITLLPRADSLQQLRQRTAQAAPRPFLGVGNPRFSSSPNSACSSLRDAHQAYRGNRGDVQVLARLCPLPETELELATIAEVLRAGPGAIYTGENAREETIKKLPLDQFQILAFATHGVIAGEFAGLTEPALVLTPPSSASDAEDGLLKASEIMALRLNADWVVLSACNTASGNGRPGAEGLSGLAMAFLFAGARSVLVSHWAVDSAATVLLTTGTFLELEKMPAMGRAEALRRATINLMNSPRDAQRAHPAIWAPFSILGEGWQS